MAVAQKIAIFPRNGGIYSSSFFRINHTGTAQILVTGLTPSSTTGSTYDVTLNGTVISTQSVASDGTLYYEGIAGNYTVGQTGLIINTTPYSLFNFSSGKNIIIY